MLKIIPFNEKNEACTFPPRPEYLNHFQVNLLCALQILILLAAHIVLCSSIHVE